jgi:hypothetical protein
MKFLFLLLELFRKGALISFLVVENYAVAKAVIEFKDTGCHDNFQQDIKRI